MLTRSFSRRWLLATALVLLAAAVMVRLGIWQLDRLEQRRAFNARVSEQQEAQPLVLDADTIHLDLYSMEYRQVSVSGEYLPEDEIVLRNQVWNTEFGGQLGVKLFTPLLIEGTDEAILVERGWIPEENAGEFGGILAFQLVDKMRIRERCLPVQVEGNGDRVPPKQHLLMPRKLIQILHHRIIR